MNQESKRSIVFRRYLLAILAVTCSVFARISLNPWLGHHAPFVTFYIAIFFVAWRVGIGPTVFATILSLVVTNTFIFQELEKPLYGSLMASTKLASSFLHLSVALVLAIFARMMDSSRRKAIQIATIAIDNELALTRSEQSLQMALAAGNMASWEWDIRSGSLKGSSGLAKVLGFSPGSFDGTLKTYFRAIDSRDRSAVMNALQQAVALKTDFRVEYRLRDKSGKTHWVESIGRLVKEDDGEARMIGILSNITQRKDAEAVRSHLSAIVESSSDAIISEDLEGKITSWNEGARQLFGYSPEEAIGVRLSQLVAISTETYEDISCNNERSYFVIKNQEVAVTLKTGIKIWVSLSAALVRDEKGLNIGISRIFRDITINRKATEQDHFLTEATALLSISLDQTTSLNQLARLLASKHCDICLIGCSPSDLKNEEIVAKSKGEDWSFSEETSFIVDFLLKNRAEIQNSINSITGQGKLYTRDHFKNFYETNPSLKKSFDLIESITAVPLTAHDQMYGLIFLIQTRGSVAHDAKDLKFFEELGRRAALSIENARLFGEAQCAIIRHEEELKERIRIEDQLRQSERLYRAIGESIDYGIWICDAKGELVYVSDIFLKHIGISLEKWTIQDGWKNYLPKEEAKRVKDSWRKCVRMGSNWDEEINFKSATGELLPILSRGTPVRNEDGEIQYWAGIHLDISRQKKAEAELIRAKEEADAANQAKSAFLANMSHEIRTPLTAIVGFSELLLTGEQTPKEKADCVSIIKRNGTQLTAIINDILDLSKVEAGHLTVEPAAVDLDDFLKDIRGGFSLQSAEKNLDLEFEYQSHLPKWILTDPLRLKQILTNIIGNAIKFTEKGRVLVRILSSVKDHKKILRFEIEDTGCGLSPNDAEKIFQPFSQADASTTRQYGGTGLGLSLSRRLARLLGGDVYLLCSKCNSGSTFVVEVPQGAIDPSNLLDPAARSCKSPNPSISLSDLKILLVEDSPDNQLLMTAMLKRAGALTEVASNGLEGIEKAQTNWADVILMDVQMPLMDGYAATSELRKKGYRKPIIALTAHALMEDRIRCLSYGFDEHISKPVTPSQLVTSLVPYCRQKKHMQRTRP